MEINKHCVWGSQAEYFCSSKCLYILWWLFVLLFVDCKFQTWMFMMYTFAGAGWFGEYGEGRAFYEHYQLNRGRVFLLLSSVMN